MEGSGSEKIITDPDPGGPDPEHSGNFGLEKKIFGLAGIPVEVDEDEETIKIVQLVKSQDTLRNASSSFASLFCFPFKKKILKLTLLS
jgi:hypothetical protein